MPRNFSIWPPSDPRALLRLAVGLLVAANVVAAYLVIWPVGGSNRNRPVVNALALQ